MSVRDLSSVLGDIIRHQQCPEVAVAYTCGHSGPTEVQLAPFLQAKREPRAAARALRVGCKRGGLVTGDDSVFRIEVAGGACPTCGQGNRAALQCGGVIMDLISAREAAENPIPVGIDARQFLQWVQSQPPDTSNAQRIQLTSSTGSLSWFGFLTSSSGIGPLLIALGVWLCGCIAYGVYAAPQIPLLVPEIFYQQVQEQIANILLPRTSPHYAHYREYYLQQYQQHALHYRELEANLAKQKRPHFNWGAFFQGIGLGTWFFAALLAFCEYQYGTITTWMEIAEEWWHEWNSRPRPTGTQRYPLANDKAQEKFLREITNGQGVMASSAKSPSQNGKAEAQRTGGNSPSTPPAATASKKESAKKTLDRHHQSSSQSCSRQQNQQDKQRKEVPVNSNENTRRSADLKKHAQEPTGHDSPKAQETSHQPSVCMEKAELRLMRRPSLAWKWWKQLLQNMLGMLITQVKTMINQVMNKAKLTSRRNQRYSRPRLPKALSFLKRTTTGMQTTCTMKWPLIFGSLLQ